MENYHDIVPVQLKGAHYDSKPGKKVPDHSKLAFKIKDTGKNRDVYVYNGIDKQILYTLFKEL